MFSPCKRALALGIALAYPLLSHADDQPVRTAQATPVPDAAANPAVNPAPPAPLKTQTLQTVEIVGARQRLDAARNGLSPDTGSSIYRLDRQDIKSLPLGDSTPLNQVILQEPGAPTSSPARKS